MAQPKASRRAYELIRTLHTYTGLFSFTAFVVFGVAGLVATFSGPPEENGPRSIGVRYEAFQRPVGAGDKQVADAVYEKLDLPLSGPIPEWAIQRDTSDNLLLNFYTVNGPFRVTVHEDRLQVETLRNSFGRYISNLHASVNAHQHSTDWRLQLWSYYVEFGLWSLTAMALTGLFMWLYTNPGQRTAALAALAGTLIFIILYAVTR